MDRVAVDWKECRGRFIDVDPRTLRLPGSRRSGADPLKLQRQIAQFGASIQGMPPLEVSRGTDGELVINNGVTRTTRFDPMNVSTAEELIGAITELRALFPDWRLGQLVANLVTAAGGTDAAAIWNLEDEQLLTAARRLSDRNRGRQTRHG